MAISWGDIRLESQMRLVHWARCAECGWESDSSEDQTVPATARANHFEYHKRAELRARGRTSTPTETDT